MPPMHGEAASLRWRYLAACLTCTGSGMRSIRGATAGCIDRILFRLADKPSRATAETGPCLVRIGVLVFCGASALALLGCAGLAGFAALCLAELCLRQRTSFR